MIPVIKISCYLKSSQSIIMMDHCNESYCIRNYAYKHFHDPKKSEWFGYLHRDGSIAQTAKGNLFKGPFHLPGQEWYCMQILHDHLKQKSI